MTTLKKLTLAACLALSGGVYAADFSDYAQVVSVTPIYERVNEPKRECWLETVTPQANATQGNNSPAGALIGGIAGGILGHQVGRGGGKDAATALGAITGAIVGDRLQQGQPGTTSQAVERCRITDNWVQRLSGYSVTYRYGGRDFTSILPSDPGNTLRITVQVRPGS